MVKDYERNYLRPNGVIRIHKVFNAICFYMLNKGTMHKSVTSMYSSNLIH